MPASTPFKLPLLESKREALENCVYCPKLCRAACPVSNEEASETTTPWGKMSLAYFYARGDVAHDAAHAATAWACSGCGACRTLCDHDNPVSETLLAAREAALKNGVAPRAAERVVEQFPRHQNKLKAAVDRIDTDALASARVALLIGCGYALQLDEEAQAIWRVAQHFRQPEEEVRAMRSCCGAPLLHSGDRAGFERAAAAVREEAGAAEVLLVGDPGCARALGQSAAFADEAAPPIQPLIDRVYADMDRVPALALKSLRLRYHDPCQLGRGLGYFDEPRAILARLTGELPGELPRRREQSECSGGGGLLPLTRRQTSAKMADRRIADHRGAGGGMLVTACAASVRRFRTRGEPAADLMALLADALDG